MHELYINQNEFSGKLFSLIDGFIFRRLLLGYKGYTWKYVVIILLRSLARAITNSLTKTTAIYKQTKTIWFYLFL